jgi:hypothetical protein
MGLNDSNCLLTYWSHLFSDHWLFNKNFEDGLYDMNKLCWPNIVQMTLGVQELSELVLLFEHGALSLLESLSVTSDQVFTTLLSDSSTMSSCIDQVYMSICFVYVVSVIVFQ